MITTLNIPDSVHHEFKASCALEKTNMSTEIVKFMRAYSKGALKNKLKTDDQDEPSKN